MFLSVLILTNLVFSTDIIDGIGAFTNKNYKEALNIFDKYCNNKETISYGFLGLIYRNGIGIKQDYLKAGQLYQKSCINKDFRGYSNLGVMYEEGLTIKQNYKKSKELYKKSCDGKNACDDYERLKSKGY